MNLVTFIYPPNSTVPALSTAYRNSHLVLVRLFKYFVRLFCSTGSSSTYDHWLKFLLGEGGREGTEGGEREGERTEGGEREGGEVK